MYITLQDYEASYFQKCFDNYLRDKKSDFIGDKYEAISGLIREEVGDKAPGARTIRRLLNHDGKHSFYEHTIDVCIGVLDYKSWEEFRNAAYAQKHELPLFDPNAIDVNKLRKGDEVIIGWEPDRYCKVRYCGNCHWEVLESIGMSKKVGDRFDAKRFAFRLIPVLDKYGNFGYPDQLTVCALKNDMDDLTMLSEGMIPLFFGER